MLLFSFFLVVTIIINVFIVSVIIDCYLMFVIDSGCVEGQQTPTGIVWASDGSPDTLSSSSDLKSDWSPDTLSSSSDLKSNF